MSHDSEGIEAGPSTGGVVFRISDGSGHLEHNVHISRPDLLRRWSLGLRKVMDQESTAPEILLQVDRSCGIDCAAVAWVVENLQRQRLDVEPVPESLARHCAVLWKYECVPDPFEKLGRNMQPRSSSGSLSSTDQQSSSAPSASPSGGSRSWRGMKTPETCRQLITIAIVLRLQVILEDEIKGAVWGTSTKMDFAALLGIDLDAIRKEELEKLFDSVFYEIYAINDDNDKLAKSIWDDLKKHKDKVGNLTRSWRVNATALEGRTPYDFLKVVEKVLTPPERLTPRHEPRAPVGARDPPDINWKNLFNKTKKAMKGKGPLHIIDTKEIGSDQQRKDAILDNLETLIEERRRELVVKLMAKRDSTVQIWKDELAKLDRSG